MKDSLKNIFSLDLKVTFGESNVWKKIGENAIHLPEIKFILAGVRFCINNLFLQDTATVATHKMRWFLKDISTRQKICLSLRFYF